MNNYLSSVLKLLWVVMGALLLLSFMPHIDSLKKVSLFADIQHSDSLEVVFQDDGVMDALNKELEMLESEEFDFWDEAENSSNNNEEEDASNHPKY